MIVDKNTDNVNTNGYCASFGGAGVTQCGTAASPDSTTGTDDGIRQR
jgi:hypothetical protein